MTFTGRGLYASSSKEPGRRHFGWLLIGAFVAVAALVLGGLSVLGGISTSQTDQEDSFDGASQVTVHNRTAGEIEVTGTEGDTVTVDRTVRETPVSSASDEVTADGDTVRADASCGGVAFFGGCRVDYRIGVPEETDLTLETSSGPVRIDSVGGDVSVSSSSGSVHADSVGGDLTASTSSGSMRLDDIGGNLDLEATSGEIRADGAGESARATTTSGNVDLTTRGATEVEAGATSGSVTLNGAFQIADAKTTSGAVRIGATEPFERISAEATSGGLSIRVPDAAYAVTADSTSGGQDISVDRDSGASAEIDARTTSGSIDVTPNG